MDTRHVKIVYTSKETNGVNSLSYKGSSCQRVRRQLGPLGIRKEIQILKQ